MPGVWPELRGGGIYFSQEAGEANRDLSAWFADFSLYQFDLSAAGSGRHAGVLRLRIFYRAHVGRASRPQSEGAQGNRGAETFIHGADSDSVHFVYRTFSERKTGLAEGCALSQHGGG